MKQTVILDPAQSQQVTFKVVPTVAGIHTVTVNGLSGSFEALATPVTPPPLGYHLIHLLGETNEVVWDGPTMSVAEAVFPLQNLWGVYHYNAQMLYYIPGWLTNTLIELQYGEKYLVAIGTYPQDWEVPDYEPPAPPEPEPPTPTPPSQIEYSGNREWIARRIGHAIPKTLVVDEVNGRIAYLKVELTKPGMAGVEANVKVVTPSGKEIDFEIVGSWYSPSRYRAHYKAGVTIWDYNLPYPSFAEAPYIELPKEKASRIINYKVSLTPTGVDIKIFNSGVMFSHFYKCEPLYVYEVATELEYWLYAEQISEGVWERRTDTFNFNGQVTIDSLREKGTGLYKAPSLVCIPGSSRIDNIIGLPTVEELFKYSIYKRGDSILFSGAIRDTC